MGLRRHPLRPADNLPGLDIDVEHPNPLARSLVLGRTENLRCFRRTLATLRLFNTIHLTVLCVPHLRRDMADVHRQLTAVSLNLLVLREADVADSRAERTATTDIVIAAVVRPGPDDLRTLLEALIVGIEADGDFTILHLRNPVALRKLDESECVNDSLCVVLAVFHLLVSLSCGHHMTLFLNILTALSKSATIFALCSAFTPSPNSIDGTRFPTRATTHWLSM